MSAIDFFKAEGGSAVLEFLVLCLLIPLLILNFGLEGFSAQRRQLACQNFAWQAVRVIELHPLEQLPELEYRLHSLAIASESDFNIEPGDLRFKILGDVSPGSLVTVNAYISRSRATATIRIPL